jgi:hypothetical protein
MCGPQTYGKLERARAETFRVGQFDTLDGRFPYQSYAHSPAARLSF